MFERKKDFSEPKSNTLEIALDNDDGLVLSFFTIPKEDPQLANETIAIATEKSLKKTQNDGFFVL